MPTESKVLKKAITVSISVSLLITASANGIIACPSKQTKLLSVSLVSKENLSYSF